MQGWKTVVPSHVVGLNIANSYCILIWCLIKMALFWHPVLKCDLLKLKQSRIFFKHNFCMSHFLFSFSFSYLFGLLFGFYFCFNKMQFLIQFSFDFLFNFLSSFLFGFISLIRWAWLRKEDMNKKLRVRNQLHLSYYSSEACAVFRNCRAFNKIRDFPQIFKREFGIYRVSSVYIYIHQKIISKYIYWEKVEGEVCLNFQAGAHTGFCFIYALIHFASLFHLYNSTNINTISLSLILISVTYNGQNKNLKTEYANIVTSIYFTCVYCNI